MGGIKFSRETRKEDPESFLEQLEECVYDADSTDTHQAFENIRKGQLQTLYFDFSFPSSFFKKKIRLKV